MGSPRLQTGTLTRTFKGKNFTCDTILLDQNGSATFSNYVYTNPCEITVDVTVAAAGPDASIIGFCGKPGDSCDCWDPLVLPTKVCTKLIPDLDTPWSTGGNMSVGVGSAFKSGGNSNWNAQANFGQIPASTDGLVCATPDFVVGDVMFGLNDNAAANADFADIEFAIYFNNGTIDILESGVTIGSFGNYVAGDEFCIERIGTTITYKKNGAILYTSAVSSSTVLDFDSSFSSRDDEIINVYLEWCT